MSLFAFSYLLLWASVIALMPMSVILLYIAAELEKRLKREGAGYGNKLIGRKMPSLRGWGTSSGTQPEIDLLSGEIHVVLALSPGCGTCSRLLRELSSTTDGIVAPAKLLVLCMGQREECQAAVADIGSIPVHIQDTRDDSTMDLWMVGFPAALVVDGSGTVIDVRHPLTVRDLVAAVGNIARKDGAPASNPVAVADLHAGPG